MSARVKNICVVLFVLMCVHSTHKAEPAYAQLEAGPEMKKRSFAICQSLQRVADRYKICIAIDGTILLPSYSDTFVVLEPGLNDSLEESMRDLCSVFRLSWERRGGVYIVTHQYDASIPQIPSITLGELRDTVKTLKGLLEPYNPRIKPSSALSDPLADYFMKSLTANQLAALKEGRKALETSKPGRGLLLSDLSQPQREELWKIACYLWIQTKVEGLTHLEEQLKLIDDEDCILEFRTFRGVRFFGFGASAKNAESQGAFVPLSHPSQTMVRGIKYGLMSMRKADGGFLPAPPDPTEPAVNFQSQVQADTPPAFVSLIDVQSVSDRKTKVDEHYQQKLVRLILPKGKILKGAEVPALLESLDYLYGLRVIKGEDSYEITRRSPRIRQASSEDLPAMLYASIPVSLRRMLEGPKSRSTRERVDSTKGDGRAYEDDIRAKLFNIRVLAVKALREKCGAKWETSKYEQIPLKELDAEGKQMLAVAILSLNLEEMVPLWTRPPPDFIRDFEQTVLVGGVVQDEQGTERFSLFLCQPLPDNRIRQGPGFANVPYRPR